VGLPQAELEKQQEAVRAALGPMEERLASVQVPAAAHIAVRCRTDTGSQGDVALMGDGLLERRAFRAESSRLKGQFDVVYEDIRAIGQHLGNMQAALAEQDARQQEVEARMQAAMDEALVARGETSEDLAGVLGTMTGLREIVQDVLTMAQQNEDRFLSVSARLDEAEARLPEPEPAGAAAGAAELHRGVRRLAEDVDLVCARLELEQKASQAFMVRLDDVDVDLMLLSKTSVSMQERVLQLAKREDATEDVAAELRRRLDAVAHDVKAEVEGLLSQRPPTQAYGWPGLASNVGRAMATTMHDGGLVLPGQPSLAEAAAMQAELESEAALKDLHAARACVTEESAAAVRAATAGASLGLGPGLAATSPATVADTGKDKHIAVTPVPAPANSTATSWLSYAVESTQAAAATPAPTPARVLVAPVEVLAGRGKGKGKEAPAPAEMPAVPAAPTMFAAADKGKEKGKGKDTPMAPSAVPELAVSSAGTGKAAPAVQTFPQPAPEMESQPERHGTLAEPQVLTADKGKGTGKGKDTPTAPMELVSPPGAEVVAMPATAEKGNGKGKGKDIPVAREPEAATEQTVATEPTTLEAPAPAATDEGECAPVAPAAMPAAVPEVLLPTVVDRGKGKGKGKEAPVALEATPAEVPEMLVVAEKRTGKGKEAPVVPEVMPAEVQEMPVVAGKGKGKEAPVAPEATPAEVPEVPSVAETGKGKGKEAPVAPEAMPAEVLEMPVVAEKGKGKGKEAPVATEATPAEVPEVPSVAEKGKGKGKDTPVAPESTPAEVQEMPVVAGKGKGKGKEAPVAAEAMPAEVPELPSGAEEGNGKGKEAPVAPESTPAEVLEMPVVDKDKGNKGKEAPVAPEAMPAEVPEVPPPPAAVVAEKGKGKGNTAPVPPAIDPTPVPVPAVTDKGKGKPSLDTNKGKGKTAPVTPLTASELVSDAAAPLIDVAALLASNVLDEPLGAGEAEWEEFWDDDKNRNFYYNKRTKQTLWDPPPGFIGPLVHLPLTIWPPSPRNHPCSLPYIRPASGEEDEARGAEDCDHAY
jgi:hypothetical protein